MLIVDIIPTWDESKGTLDEWNEANQREIPVFFYSKLVDLLLWKTRYESRH